MAYLDRSRHCLWIRISWKPIYTQHTCMHILFWYKINDGSHTHITIHISLCRKSCLHMRLCIRRPCITPSLSYSFLLFGYFSRVKYRMDWIHFFQLSQALQTRFLVRLCIHNFIAQQLVKGEQAPYPHRRRLVCAGTKGVTCSVRGARERDGATHRHCIQDTHSHLLSSSSSSSMLQQSMSSCTVLRSVSMSDSNRAFRIGYGEVKEHVRAHI